MSLHYVGPCMLRTMRPSNHLSCSLKRNDNSHSLALVSPKRPSRAQDVDPALEPIGVEIRIIREVNAYDVRVLRGAPGAEARNTSATAILPTPTPGSPLLLPHQ